ncbi:hypothetical protein DM860_013430 [Cuscuta australis]|uniref:PHD-type domain-containing protein n=1 Tax=Cuscuta australis TaxID=267555 RepID=A0A328D2Z1_9ASTE|nr:hypothetical protein DM860_013430 [Cuscuta australis]
MKPPLPSEAGMDYYTQACKALCKRSPFDLEDPQPSTAPPTLPRGLAQLLWKHSDSRKRQKKSHLGSETKSSRQKKARGSGFWAEMEDYLRELTVNDVERLCQLPSFQPSKNEKFFSIPSFNKVGNVDASVAIPNPVASNSEVSDKKDHVPEENEEQLMDGGSAGTAESPKPIIKLEKVRLPFSSIEWLLGSRTKIYLTTERPNKKRKLLGGEAGLEKLLVAQPVEGSTSLCHYCSGGDMGDTVNRLIVCGSCRMAVHQRCYGVQDDVDGSWICSWCKQKNQILSSEKQCLLCPKKGGALKPSRIGGQGCQEHFAAEFAHLFCCQWIPEVYVEDTRTMEPVVNIDGIKETRRKLICYLCKVKYGACVRCSNGACRTSFHPICAREARHRMEIWGKLGCEDVELRAFCSKHSDVHTNGKFEQNGDKSVRLPGVSCSNDTTQMTVSTTNKPKKLKLTQRNGDNETSKIKDTDLDQEKLNSDAPHEERMLSSVSNFKCRTGHGDTVPHICKDLSDVGINEDGNATDPSIVTIRLKKLIDRGKVDVDYLASEMGVSSDSLASMLNDDCIVSDLHCKVAKWLRTRSTTGNVPKTLRLKIKPTSATKTGIGFPDNTDSAKVTEPETSATIPFKTVAPHRRTKNNIVTVKDVKRCDEVKTHQLGDLDSSLTRDPLCSNIPKIAFVCASSDTPANKPHKDEVVQSTALVNGHSYEGTTMNQSAVLNVDARMSRSISLNSVADAMNLEKCALYIHPLIVQKLNDLGEAISSESATHEFDGSGQGGLFRSEASFSSGICCNDENRLSISGDMAYKYNGTSLEHFAKSGNMGLSKMSPMDEVEGEIVFYQHKLLADAAEKKSFTDTLIGKVARSLQAEMDAARKQEWDTVLVTKYLYELREAKKQGRKERRHKEAQAVLAAAAAAAAASSRMSSLRKDNLEESMHQEDTSKFTTSNHMSQQNPHPKDSLSRSSCVQVSSERISESLQPGSDFSKDHPRTCDVCGRPETILNSILVCSGCKVSVHLDCYCSVRKSAGSWHCELCDDRSSRGGLGTPAADLGEKEKPYFLAECGLCGGTTGAFRKSTDGQWVHALCVEWVLGSKVRMGQVDSIDGMALGHKGNDVCLICQRKHGVCIKCSHGHCRSTFHPYCARSAGLFMTVKTVGGKLLHKAYCARHSMDQRLKAETQKLGSDELQRLRHIRVDLEKIRLLCERIIKREKLKREMVFCSHEVLASRRETVALSALSRHSFSQSSDSATTTSMRGYTDGCRSGSETVQRSDDITVDSAIAGKRRGKFPVWMDKDQKTDDSPTSPIFLTHKQTERITSAGKQISLRHISARNPLEDEDKRLSYRKHVESFQKEMVMTSDQASMKNQRLPKGYVYVPLQRLSKDAVPDTCPQEPPPHGT